MSRSRHASFREIRPARPSGTTASFLCLPGLNQNLLTYQSNSKRSIINNFVTYVQFSFSPCAKLRNILISVCLMCQATEAPDVLCQVDDELRDYRWNVVPLMFVVFDWFKVDWVDVVKFFFKS